MVTLQDIADRAGVSVSTVSRVLSRVSSTVPISETTKQRINQLAEELGYYPNIAARALSSQRSGALGLIIPAGKPERNYQRFYGLKLHEVLAGLEWIASKEELNLILQVANDRFLAEHGPARMLNGRVVDSLILYEVDLPSDEMPDDCPAVFLNTRNESGDRSYVVADDFGGMQSAVKYLITLGHRRIGYVSGPSDHYVSRERKRGFLSAASTHDLEATILEGDLSEESGFQATLDLLSRPGRVSALIAAGDYMAIGALSAAREMGISVPSQLSIIGADGAQVSAYTTPSITTVVTSLYSMAKQAANWAIKLLGKEVEGPVQEVFPTEIEVRESCGPAPDQE